MTLTTLSDSGCFGGRQLRLSHNSSRLDCTMTVSVFLPPQAQTRPVPALYLLNGLTGTDENFQTKAGAQRLAAAMGLALISPDTSPRGADVPGDLDGAWDFGHGAGYYLNATEAPYNHHYHMHDYVLTELPLMLSSLPLTQARSICGFSMGGHGALILALRNPGAFASVSAIAPIAHPHKAPWGVKAFTRFLGPDPATWETWDATHLVAQPRTERLPILIDQGTDDRFYGVQLHPEDFVAAAQKAGHPVTLRLHAGYDHSFWFVMGVIEDHLRHHAPALGLTVP